MKAIIIPSTVNTIEAYAFSECTSLTKIELPYNLTEISDYLFYASEFTISNRINAIGNNAFAHTQLSSITIPSNVTSIGDELFFGCSKLTTVALPYEIKVIPKGCFQYCESLITFKFPHKLVKTGAYSFNNCKSLVSVDIPNSVEEIGEEAFSECSKLQSLYIGENVKYIGNNAFSRCISLAQVHLKGKIPPKVSEELANSQYTSIIENKKDIFYFTVAPLLCFVPKGAYEIYHNDKYWRNHAIIEEGWL